MGELIAIPTTYKWIFDTLHVCVMQSPACRDGVCEACDSCGCECHPGPQVEEG